MFMLLISAISLYKNTKILKKSMNLFLHQVNVEDKLDLMEKIQNNGFMSVQTVNATPMLFVVRVAFT